MMKVQVEMIQHQVDDAANKLKQLENQTVKNMGDLIEKNDFAIKSVEKQISVLFF